MNEQNKNFNWISIIDDKTRFFSGYLELIKKSIDEEEAKLEARDKEIKSGKVKPHRDEDGYEWDPGDDLADKAWEASEMEQLMYRSFVVSVFMFMESQIADVCDAIYKSREQKFSYKDLKGNGIERQISYLEKVLGATFLNDEDIKLKFKTAQIVRNALAHNDGKIHDDNVQRISEFIKKYPDSIELENNLLHFEHKYAESLIELNQQICSEIEKYNEAGF